MFGPNGTEKSDIKKFLGVKQGKSVSRKNDKTKPQFIKLIIGSDHSPFLMLSSWDIMAPSTMPSKVIVRFL